MKRAVFLDRDGVLNRSYVRNGKPAGPRSLTELEIRPEAPAACRKLKDAGFDLIVVTNQPNIARGLETRATVDALNAAVGRATGIAAFYVCPHDDADLCDCRKPKPGLLLRAAAERGVDLFRSVMVGDRGSDIEAGRRAGCRTLLVDGGHNEPLTVKPDASVRTLADVADLLVNDHEQERPLQPLHQDLR